MKPGIGKTHPVQWGPLPSGLAFFQREVVDQLFILFLLDKFSRGTGKSHLAQTHPAWGQSYVHVSRNGRMFALKRGMKFLVIVGHTTYKERKGLQSYIWS